MNALNFPSHLVFSSENRKFPSRDFPCEPIGSLSSGSLNPFRNNSMYDLNRSLPRFILQRFCSLLLTIVVCALAGCGNSLQIEGTQQLLASDAVDKSVAKIDFSPLKDQIVYFDPQYIQMEKGIGFVNANYIVSAIRQQLFAHGCRLVESKDEAQFIVEARVGALGGNQHDVIYGIPENNAINSMASMMPNTPSIPSIPELSVARRSHLSASAKVAVFAFEKESGDSIWQSGTSVAESDARHTWLFGAGPFQKGSIYKGTNLAGTRIRLPFVQKEESDEQVLSSFHDPQIYRELQENSERSKEQENSVTSAEGKSPSAEEPEILPVGHESTELIPEENVEESSEESPEVDAKSDEQVPEWAREQDSPSSSDSPAQP